MLFAHQIELFPHAFHEARDEITMTAIGYQVHQGRIVQLEPCSDRSLLVAPDVLRQPHYQSPP